MEKISQIVKKNKEQLLKKSEKSLPNILIRNEDHYEVSVYNDTLTKKCVAENTIKLNQSFPSLDKGFFNVFYDRIKANNYTDKRLSDAINHVIDNCVYPHPSIAQFISFDRKIKLYSRDDILKKNELTGTAFKEFRPVRFAGNQRPVYASLNDIQQYSLTIWIA